MISAHHTGNRTEPAQAPQYTALPTPVTNTPCPDHQDGTTALHLAVQRGHLATVQLLLDAACPADAEEVAELADALVRLAVTGGHAEVTGCLVRRGGFSNALLADRTVSGGCSRRGGGG